MFRFLAPPWLVALSVALLASCASGDAPPSEPDGVADADVHVWPHCEPGTYSGCLDAELAGAPSTRALRCNETGEAFEEVSCRADNGDPVWCLDGGCAECIPGARRCGDEDVLLSCGPDGRFEPLLACSEVRPGDVCEGGVCIELCELNQKLNSYMGCEVWAVDLDNAFVEIGNNRYYDAAGAPFAVVVGNPHARFPATVTVTMREGDDELPVLVDHYGAPLDLSPVPPGSSRVLQLPRRDVEGTVLSRLAYRVKTSIPTTIYQFNPLDNLHPVYSNDASLLLPTDVLGLEYLVMAREQTFPTLRSFVTVVATEDDTRVLIKTTAPTMPGVGLPALAPGESIERTLQRYDVLSLATSKPGADPTGTRVVADRPVAVFGGSEAANAPNTARCTDAGVCEWDGATPCQTAMDCVAKGFNTCCADHLEQQMFPLFAWGTRYIATQSMERGAAKDIWRILAAEDGTVVSTTPSQASMPVLNAGEWFEFESREHFVVEANRPILVGQFLAAQDAPGPNGVPGADTSNDAGIGDPAFMLAVPVAQYREDYVILAPKGFAFDFVNITAPAGAEVRLDGELLPESAFEPVSGTFRVARLPIEDGDHRIDATAPVGVIVYGFDQYVSYGYPGGLDVRDLGLLPRLGPLR